MEWKGSVHVFIIPNAISGDDLLKDVLFSYERTVKFNEKNIISQNRERDSCRQDGK